MDDEEGTAQTFIFLSENSDSDLSDVEENTNLINGQGVGHTKKKVHFKTISTTLSKEQKVGDTKNGPLQQPKPPKKAKGKAEVKIKSVRDGIKQLEKHELVKKRRDILYQLMVTSAIAMLHGLSVIPYFWNSILLNIYDLNVQSICMWCVLGCYGLSCIYTPAVVHRLPLKWTLVSGCCIAAIYVGAKFYPELYLVIPASVLLGLSLCPFYTAIIHHISKLATLYEGYQGKSYKENVFTFSAVYIGWISCSPLLLSLLHVIIFSVVGDIFHDSNPHFQNGECGFNYIWNWNDELKEQNGLSPEGHKVQVLLGSCLLCSAGGLLLTIVVLTEYQVPGHQNSASVGEKFKQEVKESVDHLKDANNILFVPVFLAVGMFETFCFTLFGQAFVACNFGPDSIFFIVLCMSCTAAVFAAAGAYIFRLVSSVKVCIPIYILALLLVVCTVLGGYMPYPVFYLLAALFGVVNHALVTQITANVLSRFSNKIEVSYSLFQFCRVIAYLATFALVRYHGDNSTLTGIVFATLLMALLCHIVLELRFRLLPKDGPDSPTDSSGAYVLLQSKRPPWLPEVDPTTVNTSLVESLEPKHLPSRKEEEQCATQ